MSTMQRLPDTIDPSLEGIKDSKIAAADKIDSGGGAKVSSAAVATMRTSGLSVANQNVARHMAAQAAVLALHHASAVHYTASSPQRWEGIHDGKIAARGQFPTHADCSSFATWCLWNALSRFHVGDIVNNEAWKAGYTGTMIDNGTSVLHGSFAVGDVVIYGPSRRNTHHAAIYVGGGKVVSHGSEADPSLRPWRYRNDVIDVRRYI